MPSGKEPVTIATHSTGPVEEIPEMTMDLNALSKLTSVSESKIEHRSTNAVSGREFESTYLKDAVDEQDTGHHLHSSQPNSDQPAKPRDKNHTSGSGPNVDNQTATDSASETSLRTADESASGTGLSDGQSAAPQLPESRPLGQPVVKSGAAHEGAEGTSLIRGHDPTGVEHTAIGPQSTVGSSGMLQKSDVGAGALGVDLSDDGAPSKSELSKVVAVVDRANLGVQAEGSSGSKGQPLGAAAMAQPQAETGDLDTNQTRVKKQNSTDSMTPLEKHLGGYTVRILPEGGQAATKAAEMKTHGVHQTDGLIQAKAASTAAQPQNGLSDLEKMQPAQRLLATQPSADLLSSVTQGDIPQEAVWDFGAGTHSNSIAASTSITARPELAASVSHQMSEAIRVALDRSVEIALNPAELGRVRMVLSPSDAGVTLSILAERPETLDLMRRNIGELAKSFADLGYEDISFSFEQNDQMADDALEQSGDAHSCASDDPDVPSAPTIPVIPRSQLAIAPDGVDMRL